MIKKLTLGFFSVNCYVITEKDICFIIDPGGDFNIIKSYLDSKDLIPQFILNTHGHYDHIGAVPELMDSYNINFYIHKNEEQIIIDPEKNMSSFFGGNALSLKTHNLLDTSFIDMLQKKGVETMLFPGHTPGSIAIKMKDSIFTGDLLFKQGIGRTDLPGGNTADILRSLKNIKKLDPGLNVYPGHGEDSTLDYEFKNNVYLSENFLEGGKNWL